ncbi:PREDICTED: fasciclin-1 isoform X5 [Nicrophorus vespilloides]|uniref:Fasciclin-1 isoform X5 n=1 Tax=Nicrophorus vespilloides TaxID=110193 RepID=A0ABM1MNY9_NICVS|nr:PREDICTED: fasciclin-1 isoform X5 [Nicrophorus vespilloides]
MSNLARTTDQLGLMSSSSLTSELDGNPPLWVTHKTGDIHDDIYINNARLLITHSNFRAKNLKGYDQVLHKIDEVLVPVMSPKSVSNPIYNPTAWDFIEQFESLNINPYRVRSFRQRVQQTKKEDIFNAEGGNTFFIPVDEGFKNSRPESIDAKVIDGHVIPKHVLFTAPTTKDISYDTLANVDNMKVYISFSEETHGKSSAIYVKSHNRLADSAHTKGVVMAEIVKANIPVKNGVVHLIHKPLMVVDNTVKQFLEAPTLNKKKNLYFNVAFAGNNKTLTVEGGGVNATVIQSDLAATNGIIHIIDRVLGVPYSTVLDKLRTDPLLNQTYILGKRSGFNQQLNDTTRKFTYFVPRDKAWKDASIDLPSAIKKLFMEDFTYHANQILERHLVISDIPYTMERIKQLTNDTNLSYPHKEVELPTQRDSLSLFVKENRDHSFVIYWKGEEIPVFRPNVECTNGVIHVIDRPFLKDGDIRVSKASNLQFAPHLIMLLIAKFLLL